MANYSLLDEARSHNPTATDEDLIIAVSADLIDMLGLEPPVAPEIVASYQGISRIERLPLAWAGCLISDGDDLVIKIRSTDTATRQRFTICHEIAHTFFPGYRHTPQYRCTPLATKRRRDPIEALCDVAASELLLPTKYLKSVIADAMFDLDAVEDLASTCEASLEATARRFITLWPEPTLFLRMDLTTKPSDPTGEPKLRVSSTLSNGAWPFIPLYKSVRDGHPLYKCLAGRPVDCVSDIDDIAGGHVGAVEIHARPYPFIDSDGIHHERVLALVRRAH